MLKHSDATNLTFNILPVQTERKGDRFDLCAEGIGRICNYDSAHIAQVADIFRLSEEHKTLYHGIKNASAIEGILRSGIEPRTHRSIPVSYWTDGLQLFIISDSLPITPFHMPETAFFNYAHSEINRDRCVMQLAVSDVATLKINGINVETAERDVEGWIKLPVTVKPDMLSLLTVNLEHPASADREQSVAYTILAEKLMIELLFEHLSNYSVGRFLRKDVEVK